MRTVLVILMFLSLQVFAQDNKSAIKISKDTPSDTVAIFYSFAVGEYEYANFGMAKDMFIAIENASNNHPSCDLYLAKIYQNVDMFKDLKISKHYYKKAAQNDSLNNLFRQDAYLSLIYLTNNEKEIMEYANDSFKLGDSDICKKAFILAYYKEYTKTKDINYLNRAHLLSKDLNNKSFDVSLFLSTDTILVGNNAIK